MAWVVEFLNEDVKESLDGFPLDIRARFQRIVELIQSHGLERFASGLHNATNLDAAFPQEKTHLAKLCPVQRRSETLWKVFGSLTRSISRVRFGRCA